MAQLIPYLTIHGRCEEALQFYAEAFGGTISTLMRFAEAPQPVAEAHKQLVMHAQLDAPGFSLMASDGRPDAPAPPPGALVTLNVMVDSAAEQDRIWEKLLRGGSVGLALHDAFWGMRFGMLTDKFGFTWMLNSPLG